MSFGKYVHVVGKNVTLNLLAMVPVSRGLKLKGLSLIGQNRYAPKNIKKQAPGLVERVFAYNAMLENLAKTDIRSFLQGKVCVELGPGLTLEYAQVCRCLGAKAVICCDIYPYFDKNVSSHVRDLALKACKKKYGVSLIHKDAVQVMHARDLDVAHLKEGIYYVYDETGQFSFSGKVDFIYSKATLEHVQDISRSFAIMRKMLRPGGTMFHLVDFKSHGISYKTPYDHLLFSPFLWRLMGSHRGIPNRVLWSSYEELLGRLGFSLVGTKVYGRQDKKTIEQYRRLRPGLKRFKTSDLERQGLVFLAKRKS